jgi:hypothetical protein
MGVLDGGVSLMGAASHAFGYAILSLGHIPYFVSRVSGLPLIHILNAII